MRRDFANRCVVSFAVLAAVVAGSPMWASGQDRDGVRGVREQDAAAARTANQLNATAQAGAAVPGQMPAGTDLLMQAGIVLDARNPNRMIVERVTPSTPAFLSGLRPGDVITRVNGSPVTSLAAVAQALVNGTGSRLGLQVDRNGQSRQLNLTLTDNSVRTAMRPDINANIPAAANAANQNTAAAATVGGVPINGIGTPGVSASGVTPGLGTTTAQSAGGQANATGQPAGVGQGTATAPGQAGRAVQGTTGTVTGTTTTTSGQPTTTTGNPPIVPGIPTSPSLPGNPTSPSLLVQPGGIPSALPGLPTAVPGVPTAVPGLPTATPGLPTAAQGTVPPSVPSSQGTVNPTIGGGNSPPVTGIGTTGTGATSATSSQGTVAPGVGGGTTSGAGTGATGGTSGGTTGAAGAGAGTSSGATGAAAGAGGAAAGGAGTGGAAGGGAGAGGT